jgi:hypothetical protein
MGRGSVFTGCWFGLISTPPLTSQFSYWLESEVNDPSWRRVSPLQSLGDGSHIQGVIERRINHVPQTYADVTWQMRSGDVFLPYWDKQLIYKTLYSPKEQRWNRLYLDFHCIHSSPNKIIIEKTGGEITCRIYIRDARGSNLGGNTEHTDWSLSVLILLVFPRHVYDTAI